MRAGLDLDARNLDSLRTGENIREALVNQSQMGLLAQLMRKRALDRDGPDRLADLSDAARDRIACDPTYQPPTLRRVLDQAQRAITRDTLLP